MAHHSPTQENPAVERLPKAPLNRESLRESLALFGYIRPYRVRFYAGLATLFISALMRLAFPFLAGAIIDAALRPGVASLPFFGALSPDQVALLLAGSVVLLALGSYHSSIALNGVGLSALADLRREAYGRLIALPMGFFGRRRIGELSSRLSLDIGQIEGALIDSLPQICRHSVFLLGSLVLFAVTSVRLTVVMILILPLLIAVAVLLGRRLRRFSRNTQDRLAATNTVVEETLQAIASVKAFVNEGFELERYSRANHRVLTAALTSARWRAAFGAFFMTALFGCMAIVLWFGAGLLHRNEISAGELTRFVLYMTFITGALGQAAELFSQVQKTVGATQRVRELLREPTELQPGSNEPARAGFPLPERLRGEVEFETMGFHYPGRPEVPVLQGITLKARPGERVALVGPSGAGKSTLTQLLMRFYAPDSGRLLIDGRDAGDYPLHWLRAQMAMVPQEVLLFGGTIYENIAYGKPGAGEAEVMAAAAQANADEFIRGFPEGYQTLVGDRGIKLSGGQRQRVAIARAILKNPVILILDEATSSLDSESERLVQVALERLMKGRTSFIIAHRLTTVRNADMIAVVQAGRVVETGTHDSLSSSPDGLYRRLSILQFGQGEPESTPPLN